MANAFMIISLFLLLALVKSLFLKYTAEETKLNLNVTEAEVKLLESQIASLEAELATSNREKQRFDREAALRDRNYARLQLFFQRANRDLSIAQAEVKDLKAAPPVVVIQDSGEYQFASGSAELPQELKGYIISDLVNKIEQITKQRNLYVVEIIGHTDGQVNLNAPSNLDRQLEGVAQGDRSINNLNPGSNADLGLMRALEVVKELQAVQKTGRLSGIHFRAYSAAQLILPSGDFASENRQPDATRRRIEIRFSPIGKAETIQ
jgi:flagellar motor protein MotB